METSQNDSQASVNNYGIVWEWTTTNKESVETNLVRISEETNKLWKSGVIENAYWNSNADINKFEYFPNICYFIKATSQEQVASTLDELVLVTEKIADYTVYPVGTKWLGRNTELINKRTITNSFAIVWSTEEKIDPVENDSLIVQQANVILDFYGNGIIENVYWDLKNAYSTEGSDQVTDFLFFVNVNTEEEARQICNELPFTKHGFVSYKIFPAGVFWMGNFDEGAG
ncbi:MAG: hypothetical protein NXI20_25630 [bacterium]|nr:hypothetical protein [bacterium]